MKDQQGLIDRAVKEEFLDRFAELTAAVPFASGLESLEGGRYGLDDAVLVAEAMTNGSHQLGSAPGVEAIIERFTRPVYLIQDSTFGVPPDDFPNSEIIATHMDSARPALEAAIPSTGRIDIRNHRLDWVGTGWVVDSDLVLTNRHVAAEFARSDETRFTFRNNLNGSTVAATLDCRREYMRGTESRFRVTEVVWLAPEDSVDVGILRIARTGEVGQSCPAPIDLMTQQEIDDSPPGMWVGVIGYPAYDSRNDIADQQRIFDGIYGVKRLAPGQVRYFPRGASLHHDATTLGGNSGSVVVDLASGKAVGLHFGGIEGRRNEAVQSPCLHRLMAEHAR